MKVLFVSLFTIFFSVSAMAYSSADITKEEVKMAKEAWGNGIVKIGKKFTNNKDYVTAARNHILESYDYMNGQVLFKPTLAAERPFRPDLEGALSYFVGGNENYQEDAGFAIKPWTNVRFDNHQTVYFGPRAVSMGHYYFTTTSGEEVKVEYTLGFIKRDDGIKIWLQDSSLPFAN